MARVAKFLVRKTAAQWAAANPILGLGTFGIELTTNQLKIGDGVTDWAGLHYAASPYDLSLGPTARTEQHPAEVWRLANPVLGDQIIGYESDTHRGKIGDGTTPWRSLAYINGREPVGILLLETGAALLLEDGSLLLLAGGTVGGDSPYVFTTRIEILGGGGASLLAARTTSIQITGGAGAGLLATTRIAVQGGARASLLNTTNIAILGGGAAGLTGAGPYPMADLLADAVGVNVHLEYGGSVYDTGYATIVRPRLNELGTRHIRSGIGSGTARTNAITRYQQLAAQGIKLLLINTSYVADVTYAAAHLDYVEALENRNEPDVFDNTPADAWKPGLRARHVTFWNAVRANSALNGVPVLPSPLGHANNLDWWHANFADVGSYCDVGSVHDYTNDAAGKNIPEATTANQGGGWLGFGQYYTNTQVEAKLRTDLGPDKDIWSTEIGPRYDGAAALNEHQAAKAVARHLLTRVLAHGRKRLYFYQLIENSSAEDFGLLTKAGTPRQAFHALRNLVSLFRNPGPEFPTTTLGYSVSGATADMRQYVLQRRDGSWLFVIWRGTGDGSGRFSTTEGTRATVTLTLTTPISRARRFEPTLAATLAAALKQRYLSPTSISVSVPDHPVVVELSPVYPTRSGLPWNSGLDLITDGALSETNTLATFRGRPLDCSMTFMGGGWMGPGKTWADMTSDNLVVRAGGQIDTLINAGIRCVHAMPMCLEAERGDNARRIYQDMQAVGSVYRARYQLMVDRIAAWATTQAKQEMITIRLGWEGNHGYPWSGNDLSAVDLPYYTPWWEEVAAIIRATLPYVDITWNHLQDSSAFILRDYKPADELFDVLGCDVYDGNWPGYWVDSDSNWNLFKGSYNTGTGVVKGPQGFVDYARAIGKRVSFCEWGPYNRLFNKDTNPAPAPDGSNNSVFVAKMYELFQTNADILAYENYFNGPVQHRIEPTICQPLPRAAYLAAWTP